MIKTVIGVDPGMTGAMAAICSDSSIAVTPMFIAGDELDIVRIGNWILEQDDASNISICMEKVNPIPGNGRMQAFVLGKCVGSMYGIIKTLRLPLYMVQPQGWKKVILQGTAKDKQAAIDYCTNVFPGVSLVLAGSRKPHDGIADALCIARYAQLQYYDSL